MTVRVKVLGCPVDDVDMNDLLDHVHHHMEQGIKQWYTSINVANWYAYTHFPEIATLIDEAPLITADGWPIAWASRVIHHVPLPRIPAMNFLDALLTNRQAKGQRIFLLGGQPGTAEQAGIRLQAKYPHVSVVGAFHGFLNQPEVELEALNAIVQARPSILILGMGTPHEQKWLSLYFSRIPAVMAVGIGGGIDILAGIKKRAPGWMQKSGLEWLYRLVHEPGRLSRRYVKTSWSFAWQVLRVMWTWPGDHIGSYSGKKGA